MKKFLALSLILPVGIALAACGSAEEAPQEDVIEEVADEGTVLNAVAIEVVVHENHDDHDHDHDDDYDHDDDHHDHDHHDHDDDEHDEDAEGLGTTHHFHFGVNVEGNVAQEVHLSANFVEFKLTPMSGYAWGDGVEVDITLPELLDGAEVTHYVDDHGCLMIIIVF